VRLSFGLLAWDDAFASHALSVSGTHAGDVAEMLSGIAIQPPAADG
jgi:hypothetical protein